MKTLEIYVASVELKQGFSANNKPYKFYKITDENENVYTDNAGAYAQKLGEKVIITYEEKPGKLKKDGTPFINKVIVAQASPHVIQKLQEGAGQLGMGNKPEVKDDYAAAKQYL